MFGRIVVGVDGSEEARHALQWAVHEAGVRGASVDVVNAWVAPYEYMAGIPGPISPSVLPDIENERQELVDREIAAVRSKDSGIELTPVVVNDSASHALLQQAKGADMLVVGSRGHGGFVGLLLGSVSQQVVHHARCPVVVVPLHRD